MFTLLRKSVRRFMNSGSVERFVDAGRVHCPLHRCDTEIDVCYECRRKVEIEEKAVPPFVRCRSESIPIAFPYGIDRSMT